MAATPSGMPSPPSADAVLVPPQAFPTSLFQLNRAILWQYPIIAAETLILFEAIRTVPAEARMWIRAKGRGRLNAAELIFLTIKYTALIGMSIDCAIQLTELLASSAACRMASWASEFFIFFAVTFVSAALAWRALIIFQRSRSAHIVLAIGFLGQIAVSFAAFWRSEKYDLLMYDESAHYCVQNTGMPKPWYRLTSFWYLLYSLFFDICIVVSTTRRLLRSSRGPSGLARISRMLFQNGIEYAIAVCCLNFAELIVILTARKKTPSLLHLTICTQIVCVLNLLIEEQDAVHGHGTSMTSMARPPPQYSQGPSVLPTVSVITNNSDFHHEVKRTYWRSPPTFGTFSRGSRAEGALPLYPLGRVPDDISISTEVIEKCPLTPAANTLGGCSSTASFNADPFPHLRREAALAAKQSTETATGLSIRDIRTRMGSTEITADEAARDGKRASKAPSIPPLRSTSPMGAPTSADAWPLDMGRMYGSPADGDITSASYALRSMSPEEKQPFSVSPRQESMTASSQYRVEHEIMAVSASHHRRRFSLDDGETEECRSTRGHTYGYSVELEPAPRRSRPVRPRTSDSGHSTTSSSGPFMTVSQRSMDFAAMRSASAHNSL